MNIKLQINALVLHGIPHEDRYIVAEKIEQELTRLITVGNISPAFLEETSLNNLNCSDFAISGSHTPELLGTQVAQSIYGGLTEGQDQ